MIHVTCPHCENDVFTPSDHYLYGVKCNKCGTLGHLATVSQVTHTGRTPPPPSHSRDTLYIHPDKIANDHKQDAEKAGVRNTQHYPRIVRDDDPIHQGRDT